MREKFFKKILFKTWIFEKKWKFYEILIFFKDEIWILNISYPIAIYANSDHLQK